MRLAMLDGRVVLVIAATFGLMAAGSREAVSAIIGMLAAGAGAMELHGATKLREGDPQGVSWLVRSQLALLLVIVTYCVLRLTHFDESLAQMVITPQVEQTFVDSGLSTDDIVPMLRKIYYGTYVIVGLVTVFYQGGMARYYHRRRGAVARDLGVETNA